MIAMRAKMVIATGRNARNCATTNRRKQADTAHSIRRLTLANTQMERCPHTGPSQFYAMIGTRCLDCGAIYQNGKWGKSKSDWHSTPAAPETAPDSRLERIAKIIWERHYARFYVPWNEVGQGEKSSAYRGVPVDMSADDNVSAQAYVLETANEILAETPLKEEA